MYQRDQVREVTLERLATEDEDAMVAEGWQTEDHPVLAVGKDTYLFTYLLHGQSRAARRSTIWRGSPERGWQACYHQATVAQ